MSEIDRKLKIAIIAPPWLSLFPGCFYGIENVVHHLATNLAKLGHHVELFTVGTTTTKVTKINWYHKEEQYKHIHRPYYEVASVAVSHLLYSLNVIRDAGDFDIIHDHNSFFGPAVLSYAVDLPPMLHTLHEPFTDETKLKQGIPDNRLMFDQFKSIKNLYFNGVSNSQIKTAPPGLEKRILGVVYNGVDTQDYSFAAQKKDHFICVANMMPEKGQAVAARACNELGLKLKLAGTIGAEIVTRTQLKRHLSMSTPIYESDKYFQYFKKEVMPYLIPGQIEYIGKVAGKAQKALFSNAKALLFPIQWEEPFGMAVLDALSSGTPVVAFNRGAMPEIIEHGVNGFLVNTYSDFKKYIQRVDELDPEKCRESVEKHFSTDLLAQNYLKLYNKVIRLQS